MFSLKGRIIEALTGMQLEDEPLRLFSERAIDLFQYWTDRNQPHHNYFDGKLRPDSDFLYIISGTRPGVMDHQFRSTTHIFNLTATTPVTPITRCPNKGIVGGDGQEITIWQACPFCANKVGEPHGIVEFREHTLWMYLFERVDFRIYGAEKVGCAQCMNDILTSQDDAGSPWPEGGVLCTTCEEECTRLEDRPGVCCRYAQETGTGQYTCVDHGDT